MAIYVKDDHLVVAEFIEMGLASGLVRECRQDVLEPGTGTRSNQWFGCALGIGLVGKFGDPEKAREELEKAYPNTDFLNYSDAAGEALGISEALAEWVTDRHLYARVRARQIAEELKSGLPWYELDPLTLRPPVPRPFLLW